MKCKTCKGKGFVEREVKLSLDAKPERIKEDCMVCDGNGSIRDRKRGGKDKGYDWRID